MNRMKTLIFIDKNCSIYTFNSIVVFVRKPKIVSLSVNLLVKMKKLLTLATLFFFINFIVGDCPAER